MTPLTTPPYYTPLLHPLTASLPPLIAPSQSLLGVDKGAKGMSKDELGRLLANTNSGADGYELTEQARADAKEAVTSQVSMSRVVYSPHSHLTNLTHLTHLTHLTDLTHLTHLTSLTNQLH